MLSHILTVAFTASVSSRFFFLSSANILTDSVDVLTGKKRRSMDWFERLFGFREGKYSEVKEKFSVDGSVLKSLENGNTFNIGEFTTP